MRQFSLFACVFAAACSGVAYNTTVASTPAARLAMAQFVRPGQTTETEYMTRWGQPVQKVREGGQVEYIYRDMRDAVVNVPQFGDSSRYVIVTFQYGLATAVRTSDGIACRATFNPRPPNYTIDNPAQVELVGNCPLAGLWADGRATDEGRRDTRAGPTGGGITPDTYTPGGAGGAGKPALK